MMNKLHLGDCMEGMKQFPDNYFELAISDTPYGIGEDGARALGRARPTKKWKNPKPVIYSGRGWDNKPMGKDYFIELKRVSRHQIIWGANHFIENIPDANSASWIVWYKAGQTPNCDFAKCELAYTSHKKAVKYFKFDWLGFGAVNAKEIRIHPCLPAGEKVFFNNKWVNIETVKVGDKNRYGKVIDTTSHYAEKLIEIMVGDRKTVATYNHPFLVKRLNKIYWLNAEKIEKNDCILSKAFVYCMQKPSEGMQWNTRKQKKDISDIQKTKMENCDLSIVSFGKRIMAVSLLVCKYIIKILTNQTILLKTCNLSRPLNIKGSTLVADLLMENGKNRARYVENIKMQIKKIGIILVVGLTEKYVRNAISKNPLKRERLLLQKVGSVKIINQKTKVYNLTMDNIPAFDTAIGISHNTQKPVALYRWLLQNYAKKGDKILDTHVGSGSSIIACIEEHFEYCGFELDADYHRDATARIEEFKAQGRMF